MQSCRFIKLVFTTKLLYCMCCPTHRHHLPLTLRSVPTTRFVLYPLFSLAGLYLLSFKYYIFQYVISLVGERAVHHGDRILTSILQHIRPRSVLWIERITHKSQDYRLKVTISTKTHLVFTSMRKSPILRPALQATPPSSTDSRYCSAGNAGVGVNSSMGVWAAEQRRKCSWKCEREIREHESKKCI